MGRVTDTAATPCPRCGSNRGRIVAHLLCSEASGEQTFRPVAICPDCHRMEIVPGRAYLAVPLSDWRETA